MQKTQWLAALMISALAVQPAMAVTYTWNGGDGSSQDWSTAANWDATPTSAADTALVFGGSNNVGTSANRLNQDVATPFVLNKLAFQSLSDTTSIYLGGGQLQFVADGSTQPVIEGHRKNTMYVYNPIDLSAGTALSVKNETYNVELRGPITGEGSVVYDTAFGAGGFRLDNANNTFSGGTTILHTGGANASWRRFYIGASGSFGTGDVTLQGGNLNPYNASTNSRPGGMIFHAADSIHANDFELLVDSPLFIGETENSSYSGYQVELTGDIDLNGNTLYLRGQGTGTLSGTILSTGGGGGIKKIDVATWILADTLEFDLDGTVASLIDLDDGTLDISTLTIDFAGANATEDTYVLVDYTTGGTLVTGTNGLTDNTFGGVVNLPTGYVIANDTVGQQVLLTTVVPEPSTVALLGLGLLSMALYGLRRRGERRP